MVSTTTSKPRARERGDRLRRILARSAAGLVLAVGAAAAGGLLYTKYLVESGELKDTLEARLSTYLGRRLKIESLGLRSYVPPHIVAHGVSVMAGDGSLLASAPRADVSVRPGSIPRLVVDISEIRIIRPTVHARRAKDGTVDLARLVTGIIAGRRAKLQKRGVLILERIVVEHGLIDFRDARARRPPLPQPLHFEGELSLSPRGLRRTIPFQVNLREAPGLAAATLSGRLGGGSPRVLLEATRLPVSILQAYTPGFDSCRGEFDLTAGYERVGARRTVDAELDPKRLCPRVGLPLPRVSARLTGERGARASFAGVVRGSDSEVDVSGVLPHEGRGFEFVVSSTHTNVAEVVGWLRALAGPEVKSEFHADGIAEIAAQVHKPRDGGFWAVALGSATIRIRDGVIWNQPGLLKVLSKANLTSLVALARGKGRQGVPFKEMTAKLRLDQGRVRTLEPIVLRNDTLQLAFMGKINVPLRTVHGTVVVRALSVLDEAIKAVPLLRDILHGEQKSFVPIWLTVDGPLKEPEVVVSPGRSIAAPLWETAVRIFRLPLDLYRKFKGG